MAQTPTTTDAPGIVIGRDTGVAGRLVRLVGGGVLIAGLAVRVVARPDPAAIAGALLFFGLELAVYVAMLGLLGDRLARADPWVASFVLYLPTFVTGALGLPGIHVLPAVATAGSTLYIGVGLVLMSANGYGGCEVISLPNALLRRRQIMYCPYNAVDLVERSVRLRPAAAFWYAVGVVTLGIALFFLLVAPGNRRTLHLTSPLSQRLALLLLIPAALFAASAVRSALRTGWRRLDDAARASALGSAAIALAAGDLSGVVPQRLTWPPILLGATLLGLLLPRLRRR